MESAPHRKRIFRHKGTWIFVGVFWLFLFYAGLMPFDFVYNDDQVDRLWEEFGRYRPFGSQRISRADILSNIVVYFPLGFGLAMAITGRARRRRAIAVGLAAAASLATSVVIELGQGFSETRLAGVHDCLFNLIGGTAGGALGAWLGRSVRVRQRRRLRLLLWSRPEAVLVLVLAALIAVHALDPWMPTVTVSDVARAIRGSEPNPLAGLARNPWHHWLVVKAGVYALFAVVTTIALSRRLTGRGMAALGAIAIAAAMAATLEVGTIFIQGRTANAANVVVECVGALIGVAVGLIAARLAAPRARCTMAICSLTGYFAYRALEPFAFSWDSEAMARKIPRGAAWLPLYHYAMGARFKDIHLFVRTILLLSIWTWFWESLRMEDPNETAGTAALRAALRAAVLGVVLEVAQFPVVGRVPSVTDVLCYTLGGVLGVAVYRNHCRHKMAFPKAPEAQA